MHIKSRIQVFNLLLLIQLLAFGPMGFSQTLKDTTYNPATDKQKVSRSALDSRVDYAAEDSMTFDVANKKMLLYGKGDVSYQKVKLNAGYIEVEMDQKTVYAEGILDSSGKKIDDPVFSENDQSFNSKTMLYNFETKQGKITKVTTKEGEGYIHGETVKKDSTDIFFIKEGLYTTCNNPDPHFYIGAKKLKVIPEDKIITGPAYLVIQDIPTPLALPFGFFPNKKGQASGVLVPLYGESPRLGFFLTDGGYYFAINDYVDFALRGDIYSNGSYGVKTTSNYAKRYKYNGVADFKYSRIKIGEKDFPDFFASNDFFIRWNHNQDPKARPDSRFSANVSAGTNTYNKYNAITSYNNFLTNTFQSNIAYYKTFTGTPFNLSLNAAHSQNTLNKTVDITAPELTFTTNRIYPFKKKESTGSKKWYEQIGISHTTNARSFISAGDSALFNRDSIPNLMKKVQTGTNHVIPVSTSIKLLKYFTVNPSVTYTERWYFQQIRRRFDTEEVKIVQDTVQGFNRVYDYAFSTSAGTKIYGLVQFRRGPLKAVRHVIMPTLAYSYRPDFGQERFGFYDKVQVDTSGKSIQYSPYSSGIYGVPGIGKASLLSFNMNNNIEMKVKDKKDTLQSFKKVNLIDQLTLGGNYNMAADSFQLSMINVSLVTTLFRKININMTSMFDPYHIDSLNKRNKEYEYAISGKLATLKSYNIALGMSLNGGSKLNKPKTSKFATEQELNMINNNPNDYVDFSVPWTLNVSYNLRYDYYHWFYRVKNPTLRQYTQTLNFNGDLSVTPNWKIGVNSGYDFINNDFTYTSVDIYRDLHCWEARFRWIPFGFAKSYSLDINVKASVLQDLKLSRKRSWYDN